MYMLKLPLSYEWQPKPVNLKEKSILKFIACEFNKDAQIYEAYFELIGLPVESSN